jgi:hypothetical protein
MRRISPEIAGFLDALHEASAMQTAQGDAQVPDRTAQVRAARPASRPQRKAVDLKSPAVASAPTEDAAEFDFSTFVRKLNTLRAGRSLKKNPDLQEKLDRYFNNLDEGERIAMVTFLDAIGKIITADAPPASVPDPSDPPASVKMTRARAEEVVREVVRKHFEERLRSLN